MQGVRVQIPSAPLTIMKKFLNETKNYFISRFNCSSSNNPSRVVATNLGPEVYGNIGVYLGLVGLEFSHFKL